MNLIVRCESKLSRQVKTESHWKEKTPFERQTIITKSEYYIKTSGNIYIIRKKEYLCELSYNPVAQRKKQILASLLIFLFALYYANITFFYHSHNINGFTISHSHFHGSNHAKTATHTASELSLIDTLSVFQSLQAAFGFAGIGLFFLFITLFRIGSEQKLVSVAPDHSYLRGPPTLV